MNQTNKTTAAQNRRFLTALFSDTQAVRKEAGGTWYHIANHGGPDGTINYWTTQAPDCDDEELLDTEHYPQK